MKNRKLFLNALILLLVCTGLFINLSCGKEKSHKTEVSYEDVTIPAAGGTVTSDSGITITVPAGAVSVDTAIRIREVPKSEALTALSPLGISESDVIFSFEALPSGLTFDEPITVSAPVDDDLAGIIPVVHEIDSAAKSYSLVETVIYSRPSQGTIEFEVSHFSSYAVTAGRQVADSECTATPCRCGAIKVEQSDISQTCSNGDCEKNESKVSVQFLECDGQPVENSTLKELSAGCLPELELTSGASAVSENENTGVTAVLSLGCGSLADQPVDINSNSLGTINPTALTTDSNGSAVTTFTAGDNEGTAVVTARSTASWYPYSITAGSETYNGPMRTLSVSKTVNIKVKKADEIFRIDLSITGTNLNYYNSAIGGTYYYDFTIASYLANCSFEVTLFGSDTDGEVTLESSGTGTQQIGSITVARNSNTPVSYVQCTAASLGSVNCPSTFSFKTMPCISYVDLTTRSGEFALCPPALDCEEGTGYDDVFCSWVINHSLSTYGGEPVNYNNTYEMKVFYQMTGSANEPFPFELEDGYTGSGEVYSGALLNPKMTYTLTVTKIK